MGAMLPRAQADRDKNRERVLAMFPRLQERLRQAAGTLSGGEQQMLAIGRCLMGAPELVMFDEPSLGLAPRSCSTCCGDPRSQRAGADLRAGRAERRGLAQAREPRLCAGERPDHAVGHRATSFSPTTGCAKPIWECDLAPHQRRESRHARRSAECPERRGGGRRGPRSRKRARPPADVPPSPARGRPRCAWSWRRGRAACRRIGGASAGESGCNVTESSRYWPRPARPSCRGGR